MKRERANGDGSLRAPERSGANAAPLGVETTEQNDEIEQPNYELSGLLEIEAKKRRLERGFVYAPPADGVAPSPEVSASYHLVEMKGDESLEVFHLSELFADSSFVLVGRDPKKCRVRAKHASVSLVHAVLQFRRTPKGVSLFLMDLESESGTKLCGEPVKHAVYVQLVDKDVLSFGASSREYVVMKKNVKP